MSYIFDKEVIGYCAVKKEGYPHIIGIAKVIVTHTREEAYTSHSYEYTKTKLNHIISQSANITESDVRMAFASYVVSSTFVHDTLEDCKEEMIRGADYRIKVAEEDLASLRERKDELLRVLKDFKP